MNGIASSRSSKRLVPTSAPEANASGAPITDSLWSSSPLAGSSRLAHDRCCCARGGRSGCTGPPGCTRRTGGPRRTRCARRSGSGRGDARRSCGRRGRTRPEGVAVSQVSRDGVVVDDQCVFGWCTWLVTNGHRRVRTSRRIRQSGPRRGDESERGDQHCNNSWSTHCPSPPVLPELGICFPCNSVREIWQERNSHLDRERTLAYRSTPRTTFWPSRISASYAPSTAPTID